jgi:hypothetical protein
MTVECGLPDWWSTVDGDASLLGTAGWLRALSARLGDRPVTFSARVGGVVAAALHGTVLDGPRPGELFDLWDVVTGPAPGRPLTDTARSARVALAATAPGPECWAPYLLVMFPGYECFPVGPRAADPAVLAPLVDEVVAWARDEGLRAVAFLYCGPDAAALARVLAAAGFTGVPRDLSFDLDLPGPSFADYLRALPKKRRVEAGRELRLLAEAGVTVVRPRAEEVTDDLVRLRLALSGKYGGTGTPATERVRLARMLAATGGEPEVFAAVAGDTVVSVAMFGTGGGVWTAVLTGSDYADPRSRFGYFATAYYEPVRAAAPLGVRQLRYGVGSHEAKRARGCTPTRRDAWVLPLDPALAPALRHSAGITRLTG